MRQDKNLKLNVLPSNTLKLFKAFDRHQELISRLHLDEYLCLVGGTALALQIGHRRSNDLDFACFNKQLPNYAIDQLMATLKESHRVHQINSVAQISQFKIQTGLNLLDFVRDFSIDDVKVTFFCLGESEKQRRFFQETQKVRNRWAFPLMGVEGIQVAKSLVLGRRIRSRDMYDLMILMRDHDYSFEQLVVDLKEYSINDDVEYYKSVLTGKIPLDVDDEGLQAVDVDVSIKEIYTFFEDQIDSYHLSLARFLLNQAN